MSVTVFDCETCGDPIVANLEHECTDSGERIQLFRSRENRRAHRIESAKGFEPKSAKSRAMATRAYRLLNEQ